MLGGGVGRGCIVEGVEDTFEGLCIVEIQWRVIVWLLNCIVEVNWRR